jgi:hypothetical protein
MDNHEIDAIRRRFAQCGLRIGVEVSAPGPLGQMFQIRDSSEVVSRVPEKCLGYFLEGFACGKYEQRKLDAAKGGA